MKKRLITGSIIVLAVALAICAKFLPYTIGNYIFDLFILCITMVAAFEMCNLMENLKKPVNRVLAFAYPIFNYFVSMISLKYLKLYYVLFVQLLGLVIYFVVVLFGELCLKQSNAKTKFKVSLNTILACIYPSLLFGCFVLINHAEAFFSYKNITIAFVLLVIAITFLTDTLAYCVGRLVRGPKLAPKISPNKTISGAIGGLVGGMGGAMLVFALMFNVNSWQPFLTENGIAWWHFLLVGLFGSIICQIGDLFESFIKRRAQVKDSGNILPGHGGMLDRIDAMTFNVFYLFIILLFI